jgi:hypothetical protein
MLPHPFNVHLMVGAKTGKSAEAEKAAKERLICRVALAID